MRTQTLDNSASASGIAQWYNQGVGAPATNVPNNLKYHDVMTGEMVYDAFFLHGLLLDHFNGHSRLSGPHRGLQRDRLTAALEERNIRMVGTGQEHWAHRCKICMHLFRGEDGKLCRSIHSAVRTYELTVHYR